MVIVFGTITNHTAPWVPEPNGRGTWTLLSSCVLTITLCAWTALHLNVPEHGTAGRQWLRKTKWLVLGLTAPEMVVYIAWRQRREAERLVRDVRRHLRQAETQSKVKGFWNRCCGRWRKSSRAENEDVSIASSPAPVTAVDEIPMPRWTMVHGFYAVMGGFALDCSDASEAFLPDSRPHAALTAEGLRFLLKHEPDLLPSISAEQISDKSKADGLKKFLVCVQAVWFCASCITRLANALPISLLELNAMGHAACALLIYAMWWQKPLDVNEPTLIRGHKVPPLLAYMWMSSKVSVEGVKSYDMHGRLRDEFDAIWMYRYPRLGDLVVGGPRPTDAVLGPLVESRHRARVDDDLKRTGPPLPTIDDDALYEMLDRHYKAGSGQNLRLRTVTWLHAQGFLAKAGIRFPAGLGVRKTAIDHLSPVDLARWKLAHEAIERYHLEDDLSWRHYVRSDLYDEDSRVKARVGNMLSLIGSRPYEVWFGFAVAGFLYGGLHMLAWNAPFSSRLEQIFWRVAASSVTITPVLLLPVALLFDKQALGQGGSDLMKLIQGRMVEHKGGSIVFWARIASVVLFVPVFAAGPFLWFSYVLGRVYLVVECFKNVAHLPEAVFEDVSWPAYLPHIN